MTGTTPILSFVTHVVDVIGHMGGADV